MSSSEAMYSAEVRLTTGAVPGGDWTWIILAAAVVALAATAAAKSRKKPSRTAAAKK